ncbi:MAG: hypothetical protein AB1896_20525, partial [Thermodesulfobacteriota bacterium]
LDTVAAEGLEKVLELADVLVLPTFCLRVAAKTARLDFDDPDAGLVLSALVQGKKVLAARDGFLLLGRLKNEGLRAEFDRILRQLEGFGLTLCPTDRLAEEFSRLTAAGGGTAAAAPRAEGAGAPAPAYRLITANDVRAAVNDQRFELVLTPGGLVTPLARDLAKDYSVKIITRGV